MPHASPSRNVSLPISHEHSRLASMRESDSPLKQGIKANRSGSQQDSDKQAIQALARIVEKLRRRILGGAGSGTSASQFRGEYDPNATYNLNDEVVISAGINQGTFILITSAATTGVPPYTGGGIWMQKPGGLLGQWF